MEEIMAIKKINLKDVYSSYKMRVDYKKKEIVIKYNKSFLSGKPEIYTLRLQNLTKHIDRYIKDSFRKNKITTKN